LIVFHCTSSFGLSSHRQSLFILFFGDYGASFRRSLLEVVWRFWCRCLLIQSKFFSDFEQVFQRFWSKFFSDFGASSSAISEQVHQRFWISSLVFWSKFFNDFRVYSAKFLSKFLNVLNGFKASYLVTLKLVSEPFL